MTQNQISYYKAKEEERHNKAVEEEQRRANRENERIQNMNVQTTREHYTRQDSETQRANLAREQLTGTELTQGYTKLAQEQSKIAETKRHNQAQEEISWIEANAKSKQAVANVIGTQADAELAYAKAGLTYAQTAHEDVLAALDVARTNQTNAQTDQILVTIPNVVADTQVKRATRDKVITETSYIPLNTWSNVLRNLGIGGMLR